MGVQYVHYETDPNHGNLGEIGIIILYPYQFCTWISYVTQRIMWSCGPQRPASYPVLAAALGPLGCPRRSARPLGPEIVST